VDINPIQFEVSLHGLFDALVNIYIMSNSKGQNHVIIINEPSLNFVSGKFEQSITFKMAAFQYVEYFNIQFIQYCDANELNSRKQKRTIIV